LVSSVLLPIGSGDSYIFGLIKILGNVDENRQRIATIIEDHLKRFHQTMTENVNVPRRFEQVLQAINEDIAGFMNEGVHIPLSDLHAIIGVFHNQQIFLSGLGNLSAIFMHRTAKQRYVIYELDKQFKGDDPSWDKAFITVLDGELHQGDVFYLATRVSGREISIGDLQDILITLPPSGALKRIQQHVKIGSAYGGVAFQVLDKARKGPPKKVNPFSSIERLGKTKNETAELLGEQSPDIGGWINNVTAPIMERLSAPGTSGAKSTGKRFLRLILKGLIAFTSFVFILLKEVVSASASIYSRIQEYRGSENQDTAEPGRTRSNSTVKDFLSKLTSLSSTTKFLALGAFVSVFIIIGTVSLMNSSTSKQEAQEAFTTIVSRIEEKKNAAEASLIYNDKDQARTLLSEAVALLETLPASNRDNESQIESLREEVNSVFYTLRGVTEVETSLLGTLNDASIVSTVEADGSIYSFAEGNDVYRFNELELQFEKIDMSLGSIGNIQLTSGEGSNVLFIDDGPRLGRADFTADSLNPLVSGLDTLSRVTGAVLYNENLYVVSPDNQQIVKMRPQATGFEAGTNWITSLLSDISSASSIAIDGDVYLLLEDNVLRFSSGKELSFSFEAVDPILNAPTEIWTTIGTDYLYVLDPNESRVVVYSKSGNLLAQYVNENLSDAKDIIVREDKATIIFTTNNEILQFTATHLVQ